MTESVINVGGLDINPLIARIKDMVEINATTVGNKATSLITVRKKATKRSNFTIKVK